MWVCQLMFAQGIKRNGVDRKATRTLYTWGSSGFSRRGRLNVRLETIIRLSCSAELPSHTGTMLFSLKPWLSTQIVPVACRMFEHRIKCLAAHTICNLTIFFSILDSDKKSPSCRGQKKVACFFFFQVRPIL